MFLIEGRKERLRKEKAHPVCISHAVKQCALLSGVGAEGAELPPFSGLERPDRLFGAGQRYHGKSAITEPPSSRALRLSELFFPLEWK